MKVTYSPRAVADLRLFPPISSRAARAVPPTCEPPYRARFSQLEHFAGLGTLQTVGGLRKLVVRKYPYLVFYVVVDATEVSIVTIQHAARAPEFFNA